MTIDYNNIHNIPYKPIWNDIYLEKSNRYFWKEINSAQNFYIWLNQNYNKKYYILNKDCKIN